MYEKQLKWWLVRQFFPSCSHARPAREATEALTVTVCWFGIVFVLGGERIERPVSCVFDGGHVFAEGVAMDVVRTRTGHQFLGHVVDEDCVLVVCGVLVALVGDFDKSGGIDVEGKLFGLCALLCRHSRDHGLQRAGECYLRQCIVRYANFRIKCLSIRLSRPHSVYTSRS